MRSSSNESKAVVTEGLVRTLARPGLDEYTYRVVDDGRPRVSHRFEFVEADIDAEGIDEILACVERVMRRVRRSTADAAPTSAVALHLV